ncbi:hypothetical protein [Nostoc parmelioides]|uniref:Lipoprotein n=1 Tax=Nostoc parmelioides FACHB-3921 TaxID=2692909 RepID=A0ABR8BPW8_9NOSO|nr:hypothetical protein [Nostoc parmelioides]MBD2255729.1 hypothetical protein [Nostoc parmelioides FACHB-3921]
MKIQQKQLSKGLKLLIAICVAVSTCFDPSQPLLNKAASILLSIDKMVQLLADTQEPSHKNKQNYQFGSHKR